MLKIQMYQKKLKKRYATKGYRMKKTGAHLKIENFGDSIQGIELLGDKNKPETDTFIIKFPTGEVEISRCDDGKYWVHIALKEDEETEKRTSRFVEARLDIIDKSACEVNLGDFANKKLYHLAVLTEKLK